MDAAYEQQIVDEIMGASAPAPATTVNALIELNDADILTLEAVFKILEARARTMRPLESFRQEIIERFGDAGFKVSVRAYTTTETGTYAFDVDIVDRLEGAFDPEQMQWEVTNDVLDLDEGGVVTANGEIKDAPKLTVVEGFKK